MVLQHGSPSQPIFPFNYPFCENTQCLFQGARKDRILDVVTIRRSWKWNAASFLTVSEILRVPIIRVGRGAPGGIRGVSIQVESTAPRAWLNMMGVRTHEVEPVYNVPPLLLYP